MKDIGFEQWLRLNIGFDDRWSIDGVTYSGDPMSMNVHVSYAGAPVCPVCGTGCARYGTRLRSWRDVDFGSSQVVVSVKVPRFDCPAHGVHEAEVPWAGQVSRLTRRFERKCVEYAASMPVHLAAERLGVRDRAVWAALRTAVYDALAHLDLSRLEVFCVDETSSKRGHEYVTTVTNPSTGGVVFATTGRDGGTMRQFSAWLTAHGGDPRRVRVACCDMSQAYTSGIRSEFPGAVIVYDPFHVVKAANDVLDKVRRDSGLKGAAGRGLRFEFMRNREELEPSRRERLDAVLAEYHDVGTAYQVKEMLRDMYELESYDDAMWFLLGVIDRCLDSRNGHVFDLGINLDRHFRGIIEWHRARVTNGVAEGNNSVIQSMKRSARGYRDPGSMIALIYLRSLKRNGLEI